MVASVGAAAIRPPHPEQLSAAQRKVVERQLELHAQWDPAEGLFEHLHPELLQDMASVCESPEDVMQMGEFIRSYVYWSRSPGYSLARVFQMALRPTIFNPLATGLYADAQININEDLALSSLENMLLQCEQLVRKGQTWSSPLLTHSRGRLHDVYCHLRNWYWPAPRERTSPLHQHLYQTRCFAAMYLFAPELPPESELSPSDFEAVANRCQSSDDVYYRIVARRFAGEWYEREADLQNACKQYRGALDDALAVKLDTEIGHLRRFLGRTLRLQGELSEAEAQFDAAWQHETENGCAYWRALSFGELGDLKVILAEDAGTGNERQYHLTQARSSYRRARDSLDMFLSHQSNPICRAIAQQQFRSYNNNALRALSCGVDSRELLGEIESGSPRNAMEMVLEGRQARSVCTPDTLPAFVESRAFYSRWWASLRPDESDRQAVEDYLSSLTSMVEEGVDRRKAYLDVHTGYELMRRMEQAYDSTRCAALFHTELRMADVSLLLLSLSQGSSESGAGQMTVSLFDAGEGCLAETPNFVATGEDDLRPHHDSFKQRVQEAAKNGPLIAPDSMMKMAITELLNVYSTLLGDKLSKQLPALKGRQVKIFPRGLVHEAPLHAVRVDGTALVDICDVSYGITLGLLSETRVEGPPRPCNRLTIVYDTSISWYAGLVHLLIEEYPDRVRVLERPALAKVLSDLEKWPPNEVLIGCHGSYDSDDPQSSWLNFDGATETHFSHLLAHLMLEECDCITMGACESGLGRSIVSAEYLGLPVALLSAGARYVVGSLWQTPQFATAVLLSHYYRSRLSGVPVVAALNQAQRKLKRMSAKDILEWVKIALPEKSDSLAPIVSKLFPDGFRHPYYWGAFYALGDV